MSSDLDDTYRMDSSPLLPPTETHDNEGTRLPGLGQDIDLDGHATHANTAEQSYYGFDPASATIGRPQFGMLSQLQANNGVGGLANPGTPSSMMSPYFPHSAGFDASQFARDQAQKYRLTAENMEKLVEYSKRGELERSIALMALVLSIQEAVARIKPAKGSGIWDFPSELHKFIKKQAGLIFLRLLSSYSAKGEDGGEGEPTDLLKELLLKSTRHNLENLKDDPDKWPIIISKARKAITDRRYELKVGITTSIDREVTLADGSKVYKSDDIMKCTTTILNTFKVSEKPGMPLLGRIAFLRRVWVKYAKKDLSKDFFGLVDKELQRVCTENNNDSGRISRFFYKILDDDQGKYGSVGITDGRKVNAATGVSES